MLSDPAAEELTSSRGRSRSASHRGVEGLVLARAP